MVMEQEKSQGTSAALRQLCYLWNLDGSRHFREEAGGVLERTRRARYPHHSSEEFGKLLTVHRPAGRTGSGIRSLEKGIHKVSETYMGELLAVLKLPPEELLRLYKGPATGSTAVVPLTRVEAGARPSRRTLSEMTLSELLNLFADDRHLQEILANYPLLSEDFQATLAALVCEEVENLTRGGSH